MIKQIEAAIQTPDQLEAIKAAIDSKSLYLAVKDMGLLVDNSAEEFAIRFMTAYNNCFGLTY